MKKSPARRQQGMALVVGLILLLLITLVTITSFNLGKNSLEIVGNMQHRDEVVYAANSAIQEALSTTRLFQTPTAVFTAPCGGVANTRCVDTNGDGTNDVTVTLATPNCVQARPILTAELATEIASTDPLISQEARDCVTNAQQGCFAVVGACQGNSACANSVWEVQATATDAVTQATVVVTQGAAVRSSLNAIILTCP